MVTRKTDEPVLGPLLRGVLSAQRRNEDATSFPLIGEYAQRVVAICRECKDPLLWPVGSAAERLVGAAVMVSEGSIRVRGWSTDIPNEVVLLVGTSATTPLELLAAAAHARSLGATSVHACAIDVAGVEHVVAKGVFESYSSLRDTPPAQGRARPANHRDSRDRQVAAA